MGGGGSSPGGLFFGRQVRDESERLNVVLALTTTFNSCSFYHDWKSHF